MLINSKPNQYLKNKFFVVLDVFSNVHDDKSYNFYANSSPHSIEYLKINVSCYSEEMKTNAKRKKTCECAINEMATQIKHTGASRSKTFSDK